ncbi:hypothetical protein [Cupriavidus pauculus]|jgi:hypothetical protein|uniref:hypothetical protein n=1 Tax=Cupriavidus pauculus TaxID=82633 RepID=UPI001244614D|nr:hypothetical protein [Cupriavidus pauculus]KAB0600273.1 hypothetical protein F7R19_21720 [Cupriavidus pauculus]MBY4731460.1 hypothetical protein [Cupriavidus pauculus]UAL00452.1 hypothetical protein K8O84_03525 [Cupriavidus pauculus]
MSNYSNGLSAGMAARNAAVREGRAAVAEWEAHSQKLQSRLSAALNAELTEHVERKVSANYVRALRSALAELAPDHPLLREAVATALLEESRTRAYAERGYVYDEKSRALRKA